MRQYALHFIHEYLLVFFLESVFDLIPQKDKERLNAAKSRAEGTIDVQSFSNTEKDSSDSHIHTSQSTSVSPAVSVMESTAGTQPSPMATIKESSKLGTLQSPHTSRGAVFSPFVKDPEKQRRYDQYISLVKEGNLGLSKQVHETKL